MAVEFAITGGVTCCLNISATIETYLEVAEVLGWTASPAVPA